MEKKPEPVPEKKQRLSTSTLKKNPNIMREMRPELEQAVVTKLENLGVKPVSSHCYKYESVSCNPVGFKT